MLGAGSGLTEVHTHDLKKLLGLVHREEPNYPLNPTELARMGLQHCSAPLLATLRGLDAGGVRAVVVAVLAERLPSNRKNALRRGAHAEEQGGD